MPSLGYFRPGLAYCSNCVSACFVSVYGPSIAYPSKLLMSFHVEEIYLYSNQLSGPLLSELGDLVDCSKWICLLLLTILLVEITPSSNNACAYYLIDFMVFADNGFSGTIPETLGNAENLGMLFVVVAAVQ